MRKNFFLSIALGSGLAFSGCASLTKSQVEAVNHFAYTSKNFSAYPSTIITSLSELYVKRGEYYVNGTVDPNDLNTANEDDDMIDSLREQTVVQHVQELEKIFDERKKLLTTSQKVDITFKIIDKYAQALLLLSSGKHADGLGEQAKNFGVGLDSLITTYNSIPDAKKVRNGIGGFIGSLIMAGGKQWIRSKQANEIKRFVPQADEMMGVMTDNLLAFLSSRGIDSLISNERMGIRDNYRKFLRFRSPELQNERDFIEMRTDIDRIDSLRAQTITATKDLRAAHTKLLEVISTKKNITEIVEELQALNQDVQEVRATIKTMNSSIKN